MHRKQDPTHEYPVALYHECLSLNLISLALELFPRLNDSNVVVRGLRFSTTKRSAIQIVTPYMNIAIHHVQRENSIGLDLSRLGGYFAASSSTCTYIRYMYFGIQL